jgi:hypothetical protein
MFNIVVYVTISKNNRLIQKEQAYGLLMLNGCVPEIVKPPGHLKASGHGGTHYNGYTLTSDLY